MRILLLAMAFCMTARLVAADVWAKVPLGDVRLGGALGERISRTIDGNLMKLDAEKDFLGQFRTKNGRKSFIGTGNLVEAFVCFARYTGDPKVLARKKALVDAIIAAQSADGYIGCMRPDQRVWHAWDAEDVGFVLDGLVLDWKLFGEKRSLDAAVRAADYMIDNWKNPPKDYDALVYDKELLMGLAHGVWALYEATGEARFATFVTKTFNHLDWDMPITFGRDSGLRGQTDGYLDTCCVQLEMFRKLSDPRLVRQFGRFMDHYFDGNGGLITGLEGICECFTADQDGAGCSGETCMGSYAIYAFDLALRSGACDPARAGHAMERILHNGFFAAQSRDGRRLRYYTPLVGVRSFWPSDDYCCPGNFRRIVSHLPEYAFYVSHEGILANLYGPAEARLVVNGTNVVVREETDYPSNGKIRFTVEPDKELHFSFCLRIPEWCEAAKVAVNGVAGDVVKAGGMLRLSRVWRKGDVVDADFPMNVRLVRGRARQSGRFALMRGPLVYAIDLSSLANVKGKSIEAASFETTRLEDLLVVYPETWRVVPDDTVRPGGTAILAKGSLVSYQLGPEAPLSSTIECRFTEFPAERNTATYFRVPSPATCRAVDDGLFTDRLAIQPAGVTMSDKDIVIENRRFRLTVGEDAKVKSLVLKETGEECVDARDGVPLFSVTQDRPFNNENKLIRPNKRTTYSANALRREDGRLIVGFEVAPYEAAVDLKITDFYVTFKLADFLVDKEDYDYLRMDVPPAVSFRVLQLPIRNRKNFGDWLNASWDETSAVGVVGTSPYPDIDHEERTGYRILTADLVRGQKLKGASAALIAANGREDFLDCMDALEEDYDLPRGVKSRRADPVNAFIYHANGMTCPTNIDRHIFWAKRGGFRYMTLGTGMFVKESRSWGLYGNYDWNENFPNGADDVRKMLSKIKEAGIVPGLHFMHSHVGLKSRYVTPVADPRLHKTRRFTLARPLDDSTNTTELVVYESTEDVTMFEPCRVLQFGGELISYECYTKEPPYRFLGVKRGAWNTRVTAHPHGEVGGVLDISEFGDPASCYLDQDSDLQEEIAAKIAAIYNCGFEYAYFDGSDGVNAPFNDLVSNAQYRQWKLFEPKPLFSEGAAKTHFGWHILSGANAFDAFMPGVFKRNIVKYPVAQAPISWQDMTRVNFGWWRYVPDSNEGMWKWYSGCTMPDHWQFACSQCLAWDCAATVLVSLDAVDREPERAEKIFEVMRMWEDARFRKLVTPEQKYLFRDTSREYHIAPDGKGGYVFNCVNETGRTNK